MRVLKTIALIGFWLIFAEIAGAQATYSYTGNFYTEISDNPDIAGQYDTTMQLTGTIEFLNPLGANFDGILIPIAWSFNDGRAPMNNLTAFFVAFPPRWVTDGNGNIVGWNFVVTDSPGNHDILSATTSGDLARFRDPFGGVDDSGHSLVPGVWSTASPAQLTEAIISDVQDLVEDGLLTFGQGSSLSAILQGAVRLLHRDREKQAVPLLRTFVLQVRLLVSLGRLDADAGDFLIERATSVLDGLPGSP